jgi:phosphatidylserine/phosphatidylglycerophosphate/cardiolipin synthase-like enzyme
MPNETTIIPLVGNEFPKEVTEMINLADHSIKIVIFDWRWYPTDPSSSLQVFNRAITNAHKRGVEVKAISNIEEIVTILKPFGIKIKKLETKRLVHTKLMIIDDKHIIIGSHNYTQNAFTLNYEFSVMITNCPDIQRYLDYFNNLFQ